MSFVPSSQGDAVLTWALSRSTIYQPGEFRPYNFSIFTADLRRLRKQLLFFDMMSAENITGQFDNCLFSLHKPQSIGRTTGNDLKDARFKRMARLRIDGINVDHLQAAAGGSGPISWITSGRVDAVFDIKFPRHPSEEVDLNTILQEIVDVSSLLDFLRIDTDLDCFRTLVQPSMKADNHQGRHLRIGFLDSRALQSLPFVPPLQVDHLWSFLHLHQRESHQERS